MATATTEDRGVYLVARRNFGGPWKRHCSGYWSKPYGWGRTPADWRDFTRAEAEAEVVLLSERCACPRNGAEFRLARIDENLTA